MALAGETIGLARGEQALEAIEAAAGPGLQVVQLLQVGLVAEEGADLLEVLLDRRHHAFRRAVGLLGGHLGGLQMEFGDLPGQLVDVAGVQFTIGLQGAEHLALGELAHLQGVLDCHALTAELRSFGAAGDR